MKILITGMNKAQCVRDHWKNMELKVVNTQQALVSVLEDMGHTVDQRPVEIGETLEEYDKVIAYIHSPSGFARYAYNGLWAIHVRPDCILGIDDWQADDIWNNLVLCDESRLFRDYVKSIQDYMPENIDEYVEQILNGVEIVKSAKNKMIIAGYEGGDLSLMCPFYPSENLYLWSINPYTIHRKPENNFTGNDDDPSLIFTGNSLIEPKEKERAWTFVSLMQSKTRKYLKDLNPSWEIKYYGSRQKQFKSPRLKEAEMCAEYQKNWGCLVPKYYHAGSGFWRPRVQQVANANSILLVDDKEGSIYGPSYVGLTTEKIENMSTKELIDLAYRQKSDLDKSQPVDKEITKKQFKAILE